MKIHEYQARNLFAEYGIPVAEGDVAQTPEEAVKIARKNRLSCCDQGQGISRRPR